MGIFGNYIVHEFFHTFLATYAPPAQSSICQATPLRALYAGRTEHSVHFPGSRYWLFGVAGVTGRYWALLTSFMARHVADVADQNGTERKLKKARYNPVNVPILGTRVPFTFVPTTTHSYCWDCPSSGGTSRPIFLNFDGRGPVGINTDQGRNSVSGIFYDWS